MRTEKVIKKEETITVITCDFCHLVRGKTKRCVMCGHDICWECALLVNLCCDLLKPSFDGDYPDYMCKFCWEIGEEMRQKIMGIRQKAEEEEEALIALWKNTVQSVQQGLSDVKQGRVSKIGVIPTVF